MKTPEEKKIINAIETAEEILTMVQQAKTEVQQPVFPKMDELIRANSKANELLNKLTEAKNYTIDDRNKEQDIDKLLSILSHKREQRNLRGRMLKMSIGIAATLLTVSLFVWQQQEEAPLNKISESGINAPLIILSSGENVNIGQNEVLDVKNYQPTIPVEKIANNSTIEQEPFNTIIVPHKYTLDVALDDGTKVTLNANSELRYPTTFTNTQRQVYLQGEAFFDVVKSDKPFIVSTADVAVKVYGTKFNVNASRRNVCETILISGSVGVTTKEHSEIIMKPNQLFSFDKKERQYTLKEVDASLYVTWMKNYIRCQKEPLYVLLDKLSTWYGVDFSLDKSVSQDMNVTISLSKQLPIEEFLEIVECSLDITFEKVSTKTFHVLNKKEGR